MEYEIKDVRDAKAGSERGFERLYQSIYEDLYKMAFYILGNREWALDIVSDTVLDVCCGIKNLKDEEKFERWVLKILTNKCNRKMREKYEKITAFNPKVLPFDVVTEKESDRSDVAQSLDIRVALQTLSEIERVIVVLCVVQGYKSKEVAKLLHMNASTVRSKLNRSLEKMKMYIEI